MRVGSLRVQRYEGVLQNRDLTGFLNVTLRLRKPADLGNAFIPILSLERRFAGGTKSLDSERF
jgi:hypothetical protein